MSEPKSPYKRLKLADGTTRDEHRVIMEQKIGRKLTRREVVHHDNEVKRDNVPDNLEVMPLSEHSRMHAIRGNWGARLARFPLEQRRLTLDQLREMWPVLFTTSERVLGKRYGVSRHLIARIRRGESYRDWFALLSAENAPREEVA